MNQHKLEMKEIPDQLADDFSPVSDPQFLNRMDPKLCSSTSSFNSTVRHHEHNTGIKNDPFSTTTSVNEIQNNNSNNGAPIQTSNTAAASRKRVFEGVTRPTLGSVRDEGGAAHEAFSVKRDSEAAAPFLDLPSQQQAGPSSSDRLPPVVAPHQEQHDARVNAQNSTRLLLSEHVVHRQADGHFFSERSSPDQQASDKGEDASTSSCRSLPRTPYDSRLSLEANPNSSSNHKQVSKLALTVELRDISMSSPVDLQLMKKEETHTSGADCTFFDGEVASGMVRKRNALLLVGANNNHSFAPSLTKKIHQHPLDFQKMKSKEDENSSSSSSRSNLEFSSTPDEEQKSFLNDHPSITPSSSKRSNDDTRSLIITETCIPQMKESAATKTNLKHNLFEGKVHYQNVKPMIDTSELLKCLDLSLTSSDCAPRPSSPPVCHLQKEIALKAGNHHTMAHSSAVLVSHEASQTHFAKPLFPVGFLGHSARAANDDQLRQSAGLTISAEAITVLHMCEEASSNCALTDRNSLNCSSSSGVNSPVEVAMNIPTTVERLNDEDQESLLHQTEFQQSLPVASPTCLTSSRSSSFRVHEHDGHPRLIALQQKQTRQQQTSLNLSSVSSVPLSSSVLASSSSSSSRFPLSSPTPALIASSVYNSPSHGRALLQSATASTIQRASSMHQEEEQDDLLENSPTSSTRGCSNPFANDHQTGRVETDEKESSKTILKKSFWKRLFK
eukprot:GDKJ01028447.1.p1 GENE.GDKJ01028447.1~~GDKJ01028447.1.p1  ORF type:complete len:779 (-),score=243.51 GDKJ01028447.1:125-2308(-)